MSEICGFFRDIMDDPDNPMPRLIYSDWLEENGDPERAEFIRLQCESAPKWGGLNEAEVPEIFWSLEDVRWKLGERAREGELWFLHHEEWTQGLRNLLAKMDCRNFLAGDRDLPAEHGLSGGPESTRLFFCRGLVDQLTCSVDAEAFLEKIEEVYQQHVLRELSLHSANDGDVEKLVKQPELRAVKDLHLPGDRFWLRGTHSPSAYGDLSDYSLELLASCPHLRRVKYLSLKHQSQITRRGIRALAESPYLENLTVLGISGTRVLPSTLTLSEFYPFDRYQESYDQDEAEWIQRLFSQQVIVH